MIEAAQVRAVRKRYKEMAPVLDEQSRRRFAAVEAQALGRGGVSLMARITGLSRRTIYHGLSDIRNKCSAEPGRVRKGGGGRKTKASQDPTLLGDLKSLVEPVTRGDPMHPLLWTCRSLRNLVKELAQKGHKVSPTVVGNLLRDMDYSLQANSKTREGAKHIDRDAQFGVQEASLKPSTFTISSIPSWAAPCRTASTISTTTSVGSASARITIPLALPSMRSAGGGEPWERNAIPTPNV